MRAIKEPKWTIASVSVQIARATIDCLFTMIILALIVGYLGAKMNFSNFILSVCNLS